MNKEIKNQIKIYDKYVNDFLKEKVKARGIKKTSNHLYIKKDNFFWDLRFYVEYKDGQYCIEIIIEIKTYKSDELLWTIMNMKDNLKLSDSLRARGAFSAPKYVVSEKNTMIHNNDEICEVCNALLDYYLDTCNNFMKKELSAKELLELVRNSTPFYNSVLMELLLEIENGNIEAAHKITVNELKDGRKGNYQNNGVYVYEYIQQYCEDIISRVFYEHSSKPTCKSKDKRNS